MIAFLENLAESVWAMLTDSAFLFLVGVALAGVVRAALTERNVARILKGSDRSSVVKAALVGIPLPLCSCSVLPVAHQLRSAGVGRGGTTAFLISTPETGADSILLTYSLMDPLMTIARPVTAFVTALVAGFVSADSEPDSVIETAKTPAQDAHCTCGADSSPRSTDESAPEHWLSKLKSGLRYAFTDLIGDLAPYLLVGFLLAGLAAVLIGNDVSALPTSITSGWGGYVGAILVGLPMYICATSSTPLAAVLLGAGFSPGAVLVFLLVGPATNIATLTVVSRILQKRALLCYLGSIVIVALVCGIAVDRIYSLTGFTPSFSYADPDHSAGAVSIGSALLLSLMILFYTMRHLYGVSRRYVSATK